MPIYEVNGRRANVKDDKVDRFLSQYPNAKPIEASNRSDNTNLTPQESNIPKQSYTSVEKNLAPQAYTPETGGVATFSDVETEYVPAIRMPRLESKLPEFSKPDDFFKIKSAPEIVRDARNHLPQEVLFDRSIKRYEESNDLLNSNRLVDEDTLPPIAREWLEKRKVAVEGPYVMGAGRRTTFENTPEDIDLIRRYLASDSEGQRYYQDFANQKKEVDDAVLALKDKIKDYEENAPKVSRSMYVQGSPTIGGMGQAVNIKSPENYRDIEAARGQLIELERLQKAYDDRDENAIKQFFNELGRRSGDAAINAGTLGLSKLLLNKSLNSTLKDEDNILTREAIDLLGRYQAIHSADRSIAQDIAKGVADNADFMAQFAATGGIASALTKGASTAIARKLGGNIAAKAIGGMSESMANAFVRTAVMPSTLATAYEINTRNPGSFLDAYAQSFGQNYIENFSEGLGEFMPTRFRFMGKENSLANRIGKHIGFQGMIPEFAEEQIATIFHSAAGDGQAQWSDLVDPRNQLVTLGTIAAMQLPYTSINAGGYAAGKAHNVVQKRSINKGYQSNLLNMNSAFGKEAAEIIQVINQKLNTDPEGAIPALISAVAEDGEISDKQKDAIGKYGLSYLAYSGLNKAKTEEVEQATKGVVSFIEENTNPKTGTVMFANIAGQEAPVQVMDGNIHVREDGSIDYENSDKEIYYLDSDGNKQVAPLSLVEKMVESIPAAQAVEQAKQEISAPIVAQQENEEVRPYEVGETVRSSPDGTTSVIGEVIGTDDAGNYILSTETPEGISQMTVEPRQIINEDNLQGVENGTSVVYTNENGEQVEAVVATSPDLYAQGLIGFENGDVMPISSVVGLTEQIAPPVPQAQQLEGVEPEVATVTSEPRIFEIDKDVSATENGDGTFSLNKQYAKSELKKAENLVKKLNEDYSDNGLVFESIQLPRIDPNNPFEKPVWGIVARIQQPADTEIRGKRNLDQQVNPGSDDVTGMGDAGLPPSDAKGMRKKNTNKAKQTIEQASARTKSRKTPLLQHFLNNTTPANLYQAALMHLMGGGKFSRKDYFRQTGYGPKDLGVASFRLTNDGDAFDTFESDFYATYRPNEYDAGFDSDIDEITEAIIDYQKARGSGAVLMERFQDNASKEAMDAMVDYNKELNQAMEDIPGEVVDAFMAPQVFYDFMGEYADEAQNFTTFEELEKFLDSVKEDGIFTYPFSPENYTDIKNHIANGRRKGQSYAQLTAGAANARTSSVHVPSMEKRAEDRRDHGAESGSDQSRGDKNTEARVGEEQRIVDEASTAIDAEITALSEQIRQKRTEYAATKARIGNAYSEDNQTSLFPQEQTSNALFEVSRDYSQSNVNTILQPIQQEIDALSAQIEELKNSREKRISEALENYRSQGFLFDEIVRAESEIDTNPTEAQKEAGNYKKGKVTIQGFDISIEQPKGSERSGVDENGNPWSVTMNNTYGYIRKTEGKDGEHLDVFLGENPESQKVFVVDQVNPNTGQFDEHKVMLGFDSVEEAQDAYLSNYEEGWQGLGNITEVDVETFRNWADSDTRRIKPFAEYKEIQDAHDDYVPFQVVPASNDGNTLVGVHNISARKFLFAMGMGGLANPSMAVIDSGKTNFDSFGEITLIASPALIEKSSGQNAGTFGADIYSPRYPHVEYTANEGKRNAFTEDVKEYMKEKDFSKADWDNLGNYDGRRIDYNMEHKFDTDLFHDFIPIKAYYLEKVMGETLPQDISSGDIEAKLGEDGDFRAWANEQFAEIKDKEQIFLGYTPLGNRRYAAHTLDNVSRIMKQAGRQGGEGVGYGLGSARAHFAPKFTTLKQIRKAKYRLQNRTEFEKTKAEFSKEYDSLYEEFSESLDASSAYVSSELFDEYMVEGLPRDVQVSPEYRERFNTFRASLREMPAEYFETKFERPVSLNEFSYAIVPNDTPKAVRDLLGKSYLTVIEYDPSVEGDRFEKIKALPQSVKFQKGGNAFKSIGKHKFNTLVKRLKKTGLAKEIITKKADFDAKLSEVLERKGAVMRNNQGDTYGFVTPDGTVYLDSSRMNANTPIHEFGHLWNSFVKKNNPELWARGAKLIQQSGYWQQVNDNPAYANLSHEQKIDEALAMAIGDKGESAANTSGIKTWLNDVWNWIKGKLGVMADVNIEDMTLSDFTDLAVDQLLGGEKVSEAQNKQAENLERIAKSDIFVEDGKERTETRLGNRQTVGGNTLREALGSTAQDRRIAEAAEAGLGRGSGGTAEEGIPQRWDKNAFLGRLEVAARENGTWIDDISSVANARKKFEGGYENEVYLSNDGKNVVKLNNLNFLNDNDTQYERTRDFDYFAERIKAHNELFPKDKYQIIGFAENSLGEVGVVMTQPFVEDAKLSTNEQVDEYLKSIGFEKTELSDLKGQQGYTNGKYELSDIKPQNVLVDKNGDLRFIDLDITPVRAIENTNGIQGEQISKQEISEMAQIKKRSVEDGTFMLAPNGEPTSLTERQWLQVRTTNFKEWFGDWQNNPENASKVIDENGEPLVVYHGTNNVETTQKWNDRTRNYDKSYRKFTVFDSSEFDTFGHFFTNNEGNAGGYGNEIYATFLNLRNPLIIDANNSDYSSITYSNQTKDTYDWVEWAQSKGYDGAIFNNIRDGVDYGAMNESISDYVAFKPNQIKSATENTGEFNPDSNDIRFQSVSDVAKATGSTMTEEMRDELDKKLKSFAFRLREAWEDKHLPVKSFFDVLRANGTEIAEYNDFYKQATHVAGKTDAQLERYNKIYQKPLNEAIRKLEEAGFEYRDIENYVILKHGLERNEWMRRDAIEKYKESHPDATPEQIERFENSLPWDYSGITAVQEEVGMTAENHIEQFERKAGKKLVDDLWKRTKDATSFALNKQLEGGLIDKKTLDELNSRYEYYVPLRGHDAETAEDRWDYSPNMGTYFVAPLVKAKGRRSRSESPFAYISSMAQSAINSSNKNILNQTMLRLARKDKSGLLGVNKAWYVESGRDAEGVPTYEVQSPTYSENPEQYRQNIEEFEERMQKLAAEGMAYQSGKKLDIGKMFIKRNQADQHEIHVYQNGTEYVVYINANPAVARSINGANAKDLHKDLKYIANVSRQMAANFTTRNPIFVLSNFSRDYIFASSILPVKEDAKYALQFQRNMPRSADALQRYARGKADLNKKQDRYLNEYIMNGAKTGFSHIVELQKIQKEIERDIKSGGKKGALDYTIRPVLETLEAMNDVAENMSRLSVYITSREQGRSITQSVSDAKEVTVNFNRSGAGGMGSQWVRPLYLFVNAGIQALSNFSKAAIKNPGKAAALISGYALTGFLMPLISSLLGGEEGEEEYWKLSDWERQNNLCIYTGNGFIKIPLPHELRVFHKMGDEIHQAINGKKDVTQTLIDTTLGFADLVPANPFGAVDGSWADMMPDALKPIFQIAANRNFTGSRITNEWADPNKPGYLRVRTNKKGEPFAPAFLVKLAEGLDKVTGGDGVEKGFVSPNPDIINHIMRGYFGGLYGMTAQGLDIVSKTYDLTKDGEFSLKVRETPLKTFYASSDDLQTASSGLSAKYFKVADDVKEILRKEREYKKQVADGKLSIEGFAEKTRDLNLTKANKLDAKIKQIKKYESSLKELDGQEQKERERIIANLKGEVVEMNNDKK